jgi:hypothetical protein
MIRIFEFEHDKRVICEFNGQCMVFPSLHFVQNQFKAYGWRCISVKEITFNEMRVKIHVWKEDLDFSCLS